jgi:hypothetical protein
MTKKIIHIKIDKDYYDNSEKIDYDENIALKSHKAKIISPKAGDQEIFLCMNEYNGYEVCKNVCKHCSKII